MLTGFAVRGPLAQGASALLTIELGPPLGRRSIPVTVMTATEDRELAWKGGIPMVMRGHHGFRLEPSERGTQVVHYETFTGVLSGVLVRLMESQMLSRYRRVNESLRDHCEQSFLASAG